jgi:hypothetical protein
MFTRVFTSVGSAVSPTRPGRFNFPPFLHPILCSATDAITVCCGPAHTSPVGAFGHRFSPQGPTGRRVGLEQERTEHTV